MDEQPSSLKWFVKALKLQMLADVYCHWYMTPYLHSEYSAGLPSGTRCNHQNIGSESCILSLDHRL